MKILTVCLGNICRSPAAEAALHEAFTHAGLADRVEIDSAGTGSWHLGHPPDARMAAAARAVGLRLEGEARRVTPPDLDEFDLVLAMDRSNERDLMQMARSDEARSKIKLFRSFEADADDLDTPDPYYGGDEGFAHVVEIVRAGAKGVVAHVQAQLDEPAR